MAASLTAILLPIPLSTDDSPSSSYSSSASPRHHRHSSSSFLASRSSPHRSFMMPPSIPRSTPPRPGQARSFAMDIAEEAQIPQRWRSRGPAPSPSPSMFLDLDREQPPSRELSLPRPPKNNADDPSLQNPLLRLHRMGCGWLGVIVEWDGVIVEDNGKLEREAWMALAQKEGRNAPPAFLLRKAEGMKNEQVISEVFCWSRDSKEMRRMSQRKEELLLELQGGSFCQQKLGSFEFLQTLKKYSIPIALASTKPKDSIAPAIKDLALADAFSVIVTAEDVYRGKPDPEMYIYAAQLLGMIPERCIVVGNSNSSIEAAHDAFMKCIAVAGKHPIYELGAADLVITRLDNLSFVDLKNLADLDSPEFQPPELQTELEPEEEPLPQSRIGLMDRW